MSRHSPTPLIDDDIEKGTVMTTTTVQDRDVTPAPAEDETVTQPAPRRGRPRLRRALRVIRTTIVLLVLLAAAAAGGTYVVQRRLAAQAFVDVGSAVLTAPPVPIGSANAGVVTEVRVNERDSVTAGAELAKVQLTADGTTKEPKTQVLRAPVAGIVTDIAVTVGGVARAGEPVLTMYDPTKLTFLAEVPVAQLRQLRLGMTTYVDGAGLGHRVATTLQKVEPRVGTDPSRTGDQLTVVLQPVQSEMSTVRTLVPGLQFEAVADTNTSPAGTPAVNSA